MFAKFPHSSRETTIRLAVTFRGWIIAGGGRVNELRRGGKLIARADGKDVAESTVERKFRSERRRSGGLRNSEIRRGMANG